ncbi:hypothetical protein ACIBG0_05145 [Nocardia sp. NPDC050630]|uniref:hypothetical protein n=1 Tax=Nocardia sp. NPDC050630 TaxID=3364321 RepID=UPI0037B4D7FC
MAAFQYRLGALAHNGNEPVLDAVAQTTSSGREVSRATWIGRGAVVLALVPLGAFYLGPRIYDLTTTPDRLHHAVEAGDRYNPALVRIADHERVTVGAFAVLDKMRECLAGVLAMGNTVAAELDALVGHIAGDLQATLDHTGVNVAYLVGSLDALTTRVSALQAPANGAAAALSDNRATMAAILDDVRATAAEVHNTRVSAESAAGDLSGR